MHTIFDKARETGGLIRESEEAKRLADARSAYGDGAEETLAAAKDYAALARRVSDIILSEALGDEALSQNGCGGCGGCPKE